MVIIRADGNGSIGMGHIGRCMNIAKAIKESGSDILWIVSSDSDTSSLLENGMDFIRSKSEATVVWNEELSSRALSDGVSCILIDSFLIKKSEINSFFCPTPIYYLDDLNLFDYNVNGIINYNFEANESMYSNTQFPGRKLLLGPKYFPLNSELSHVPYVDVKKTVQKVLITSGSTDPCNIADKILKSLDPSRYADTNFCVLIGKFFDEDYKSYLFEKYSKYRNVEFIAWGQNLVGLYENTDIMIAPGATMAFEASALGIPCICYLFADNQKAQCLKMEELNLAPFIGDMRNEDFSCLLSVFDSLFDGNHRKRIQSSMRKIIDRCGAERIAQELLRAET